MPNPKQSAAAMRFKTGAHNKKHRGPRIILKSGVFLEHTYVYGNYGDVEIVALADIRQFYDGATQYLKDKTQFTVDVLKYGQLDKGWTSYGAYDDAYGGATFVMRSPEFLAEPWGAPSHSYIYVTYAPNINYVSVSSPGITSRSDDWGEFGHPRIGASLVA